MNKNNFTTGFWEGEVCEYCGGPIIDKHVTIHRTSEGNYFLFEHVPAGVCKECGTRYYAANILKRIEERIHGQQEAERNILVPVYSI